MKRLLALLLVTGSLNVFADQCQLVSKSQAKKAIKALQGSARKTGGMLTLCQLCGDTEPKQVRVNQLQVEASSSLQEVLVNGLGIDLAYTFVMVKPSDKRWVNLAKISGCEFSRASQFIYEVVKADGSIEFVPSTTEVE